MQPLPLQEGRGFLPSSQPGLAHHFCLWACDRMQKERTQDNSKDPSNRRHDKQLGVMWMKVCVPLKCSVEA